MFETKPASSYRADIDGLRAVAVLCVIFYHLKALKFWGGYIGVDVFFVISGFLISSTILKEFAESRFSISAFYQRRLRRIFPALIVVMACTVVAACAFLLPSELEDFAKSLLAASLSVSNFFFWLHSGYFDAPAADQALLHTWSLAVEEQFYIFFPLCLILIRKYLPGKLKVSLVTIFIASFAISAVGAYKFQTATFYLPATRAWELLTGTLLSLRLFPVITSALWRNVASACGILLIIVAAFKYQIYTPFPGIAALAPCVGAALIIAAGQHGSSLVGRVLSSKPFVFIGLISYSLYLWHWPLIVFQKMSMIVMPGATSHNVKGALFLLSILAATLSWKYVETPFRKGRFYMSGKAIFTFATASTIALIAAAFFILQFRGFPARYSAEEIKVASSVEEDMSATYRIGTCYINTDIPFNASHCLAPNSSKPNYLLLGDSHAAHLWYGLDHVFPSANIMEAASSGCEPTLTHRIFDTPNCNAIMDYVLKDYLPSHHVDEVLLAARWEPEDLESLGATIEALNKRSVPVILFGPIMEYDSALPRLLAASLKSGDPSLPTRHELTRYRALDQKMAALAATDWHVPYISYYKLFCPNTACMTYAGKDQPMQFDYGHLTRAGSLMVAEKLKDTGQLDPKPARPSLVSQ